jgi:tetratricopeptide (TPR) repeat protein
MRQTSFLLATLFAAAVPAAGQKAPAKWPDTLATEIDKAYLSGDSAKVAAARALAERVATAYPNDGLILHYEAFAVYREATLATGHGKDATAAYVRAKQLLEASLKTRPLAESNALLASIDGSLIAGDPSRAMELGMESQQRMGDALASSTSNPRVWLMRGINSLYTPAEYGGGVEPARQQLEHAVELFAKDAPKPGEPTWGRAEVHVWLGQVYEKANDKARAAAAYKAALDAAPGYSWARALSAALK